jgi:hypothetical protein
VTPCNRVLQTQRSAWLLGVLAAFAASGCASSPAPDPDPVGFTFHTADGSLSSIGWSGVFHNIEGDLGAAFGVKATSCANGVCQFEGPTDPVDLVKRRRCLYRTSMECTADSDCPPVPAGKPTCAYIYDSPLSISLQGGACAFTYIPVSAAGAQPTIRGSLNLRSGALDITDMTVYLALNARSAGVFQGVCPVCAGDDSPNDGMKKGRCQPGMDPVTGRGDPGFPTDVMCDVNRYGKATGYNLGYSMDCSPTLTPNLGAPTSFGGTFSSSGTTVSITSDSPDCGGTNPMGAKCFCGMCNDSSKRACTKQSDCATGVSCIGNSMPGDPTGPGNVPVAGNLCDGGACNWNDATGSGMCHSSILGTTIGCFPAAVSSGNDRAGNQVRISAPGDKRLDQGVYYADTANASCTPAGMSSAVNQQVGLPGLTFQKRNFRIIPELPEGPQ